MSRYRKQSGYRWAVNTVLAVLCLAPAIVLAADNHAKNDSVAGSSLLRGVNVLSQNGHRNALHPGTPMVLAPQPSALAFDLGGSDTRKLQLTRGQPILLQTLSHFESTADADVLGLDAIVEVPLYAGLSLGGSVGQLVGAAQFQSLGSIQCLGGTLRPDSYTASGCRFIDDSKPATETGFDSRTLRFGAGYDLGNVSASLDWFTASSGYGTPGLRTISQVAPAPLLDNRLLSPMPGISLVSGAMSTPYLASEMSGIDLNFLLGFATDTAGTVQVGLALTRVINGGYSSFQDHGIEPMNWRLTEPFNSAVLDIAWNRGSFSSGVRGYYRESVSFLHQDSLDSVGTFDVHVTWRAPWNANLSLGASNILGAGTSNADRGDKPADRYESIYGRIPYVRYQQDL